MYKYICPRCGIPSYSVARLDDLTRPVCSYCGHRPIAEVVEKEESRTNERMEK